MKTILITALAFAAYFILYALYFKGARTLLNEAFNQIGISHIVAYLISGIPIYAGIVLMHRFKGFFHSLGLDKSILKGIAIPLFFTLPMFIGFAIVFSFNSGVTLNEILVKVIAAAFFEELFFRGFLFGQIFRYTRLGFVPAIILGAVLFAAAHLYQSRELATLIGVFAVTFMAALLFAWLYAEWKYNLWVPIFLHLFMNLSWMLFSVSDNALGGVYANAFRVMTIALAISFTVIYKIRKKIKLEVNRETVWMKAGKGSQIAPISTD